MSDLKIKQSTQFTLKKLAIVSKIGIIDISGMFEELNVYDCLFNPCMTATIMINDALGLSQKLSFDGSEVMIMELGKTEDHNIIRKSFRIYKQSNKQTFNKTSETYLLHMVSDEFTYSQQIKISQSYTQTYSEIAKKILSNYLKLENKDIGIIEPTIGMRTVVIPNWNPIDTLQWLSKRSVNESLSPTYLFFENRWGYNFVTVSTLMKQNYAYRFNYQIKNINIPDQENNEFFSARHMEVVSQFDMNENIRSGVYAGRFVGIDVLNRKIGQKGVNNTDLYSTTNSANKTPNIGVIGNRSGSTNLDMYDSRRVLFPTGVFSGTNKYIKDNSPNSVNQDDDTYNYILQRTPLLKNLMNQRIKVVLSGNFDYTSGMAVYLDVPNNAINNPDKDNKDVSLSGKYLVLSTKHIVTPQKHETVMEVGTDSTTKDSVYLSAAIQEEEVINYG